MFAIIGKVGLLIFCFIFASITKHSRLFLLNRHQTACAWCLGIRWIQWYPVETYVFWYLLLGFAYFWNRYICSIVLGIIVRINGSWYSEKYQSSVRHRDLNSRPSEFEFPSLTTRPGLIRWALDCDTNYNVYFLTETAFQEWSPSANILTTAVLPQAPASQPSTSTTQKSNDPLVSFKCENTELHCKTFLAFLTDLAIFLCGGLSYKSLYNNNLRL